MIEQEEKEEKYTFRFMTPEDIEDVVRVERDAFRVPWDPSVFMQELTLNQFAHYIVYEESGTIFGYCGMWVVMEEAQITNVGIHSSHRGQGHGERLMRYVLAFLRHLGVVKVSLEVRVSNEVAQRLYKKVGFLKGGIRKNYYADNQEDALVMWVELDDE
ncbi:ribosomal protein S18-alanine N-acetyltransferase [Halalkalibacter hemicellulosilyticus]|uniref:Ribosomal-protein-S18p-alanine acetyltransferase n=1 Tax=Halalkalibacter hemicellulosilyticusJCM 9152 TaxID=1236971 RepID=W4QK43_9BACI|nr:ribosomal protein S18-alanine N-acetyltransferase [Halalkalibacter hemicellulosilyticus]GAE32480.1 ribosomal-protein-S18p-alanine acetyltransferase [Halalkalibacter hemicellulosilyticusJCM 9152]